MSGLDDLGRGKRICESLGLSMENVIRVDSSDHAVFFVGDELVLKIYNGERNCFERECKALELVEGKLTFSTPKIVHRGVSDGSEFLISTRLPGKTITRADLLDLPFAEQMNIVETLALGSRRLHDLNIEGWNSDWPEFMDSQMATFIERQIGHGVNSKIIDQLPDYIRESIDLIERDDVCFLHGDIHLGNLCFERRDTGLNISGLFDFADSRIGCPEYDMLAVGVLIMQGERELQRAFFRAYGYADSGLDAEMRRRLMMLTMLYETSDLRRYALRLRPDAVDLDLYELEEAIWNFV